MALYKTPKAAIIGAIKALNGVTLIESEYVFGLPVAGAGADGKNTSITLTAKDLTSTYDGSVTVRYTRLQLSDLLILVPDTLQIPPVATTLEFATAFNKLYGTAFLPDDLVNEPVVLEDGAGTVTLNAAPNSLGWLGNVTFSIMKGRLSLADYVKVVDLPGLNFPDPYEGKPFGWAYSYWRNYSPVQVMLESFTAESPDWTNIKDVLTTITGDPWVLTGSSRYSLEGAVVSYKGATSGASFTNDTYQKVLVVTLSEKCLGYSGRLYFHYNVTPTDI